MNTTKLNNHNHFKKLILNGLPTDLVLLNTLFLFRFFYHTIGIYAISLSDVLCQRLQID